ncbi:MAG: polysaccharide export protein [Alphaproteobacteria bacterium]|nr:polysaccharide export protein [Alphaproteobacteria bacterium]MDE2013042.1 polysaccharide export protein [Alphaproteobacteria bacterium]MDE2073902.1 polysaccharide export protein [Alphaproteobacteria bacterium]MDE2351000.1 polysaccharide export protein [Alphaproteobacteria bacterium]
MRAFGLIVLGLMLPLFATPAGAGDAPPLRYSVEADGTQPEQSPPVQSQGVPAAAPLRYSVEQGPLPPPAAAAPVSRVPVSAAAPVPPAHQPEQVVVQAKAAGYRLGSGDKVHVTVYDEKDLTGDFQISGSGQIAFPLIGEVRAAGLTAPQLGDELAHKLAAGYLIAPRVAVEVATYRPFYVVGEVNKPGEYPYVNGMTALNAIALGGGYTPHAAEGVIYVRHEGQATETREEVNEGTKIEPGDVVRVSESGFWVAMSFIMPLTATMADARYGVQ